MDIFTQRAIQLAVLLYKNFLLHKRRWKFTIIRVIHPALFVLILWLLNTQHNSKAASADDSSITDKQVGPIPKCKGHSCITILYSPAYDSSAYTIMSKIATDNNFRIPSFTDMQKMNVTTATYPDYDILAVNNTNLIQTFLATNMNTTLAAIAFNDSDYSNSLVYSYNIFYNSSIGNPLEFQSYSSVYDGPLSYILNLQVVIEAALVQFFSSRSTTFDLATRRIPIIRSSASSVNPETIAYYLAVPLLFCTYFMTIIICLNEIRDDQTTKLRQGLVMMGMKELPYWLHWFLTQTFFVTLSSVLCVLVGYITGLSLFRNSNPMVLFFAFFLYGLSCFSYGFFFSTFSKTQTKANVFTVVLFLLSIGLSSLFSGPGFYGGYQEVNIPFIGAIVTRFPGVDFSQIITDVAALSTYEYNATSSQYQFGPGFQWKDLHNENPYDYTWRTTDGAFKSILVNIALFAFLAWFIDNVRPGEYGTRKPIYFFLMPSYWGFGAKAAPNVAIYKHNMRKMHSVLPDMDKDITREYQQTMNIAQTNASNGVIILKMSKTYDGGARALDSLTVHGAEGSVLCLLGHNGAGKTTSIACMTGLYSCTSGDALLYGYSVVYEMDEIRKIMGVCPQHDILWGDLTAREHLYMFSKLKGINDPAREINERLRDVRLEQVGNHFTSTFSGGMKRRLSVAIASIGDPKVIFMDEPTSGLDPRSRLHITQLVQKLKQNRVIVLTTHSMEEADTLGDKIAILALGRLRAVGDTLHLKSRYGGGYNINLVCEPNKNEEVTNLIAENFPSTKLVYQSAGNLVYTLPYQNVDDVAQFFSWIERGSVNYISDWGVSHTTLEEVFLRITHGANEGELDLNEQLGIHVTMDGEPANIGTILIDRQTTLTQARFLISSEIANVPIHFVFLANGMPLNYAQENSKLAYTFAPTLIIKEQLQQSQLSSSSNNNNANWQAEKEQLVSENRQIKSDLIRLEEENRELKRRLLDLESTVN